MYSVPSCMVCGEAERTVVAEYNRLIFLDDMWQEEVARFDYSLCHGCGLVYATRRPEREEYELLYRNFNEFLMRDKGSGSFSSDDLTPETREEIDSQFVPWWELRGKPTKGLPVRRRLLREMDNLITYAPYIMLHVPLEGAKVLQIRAKSATLADFMKRVLGAAQVDLITLFPSHEYLANKNPGFRVTCCLDYEKFVIPFQDKYHLIIENHILIHMLDINQTFDMFTSHLEDGGFLFMQSELSDTDLFANRRNLFAELRPFHYQQFDFPTLERMFRRFGFEAKLVRTMEGEKSELFGLVQMTGDPRPCPRMPAAELRARLSMYEQWRDESILSLPKDRAKALFGDQLEAIWERVRRRGGLKKGRAGAPAALRKFAEAGIEPRDLEIGEAAIRLQEGLHARAMTWAAARLRGTRSAHWLSVVFGRTKLGEWLRHRVLENPAGKETAAQRRRSKRAA
jgi:hypothetical protein